jgi:hypothetical protein
MKPSRIQESYCRLLHRIPYPLRTPTLDCHLQLRAYCNHTISEGFPKRQGFYTRGTQVAKMQDPSQGVAMELVLQSL